MDISSIDDLLATGKTSSQPAAPEHQYQEIPEEIEEMESESSEYDEPEQNNEERQSHEENHDDATDSDDDEIKSQEDEYGNKKEVLSKNMQKRIKKIEQKHAAEIAELRAQLVQAGASREVQKAAEDFKFDPASEDDFEEQFAQMVRQTIAKDEQMRNQKAIQQQEYQEEQEFRGRFEKGMHRFDDFIEVVNDKPIDAAMTMALRGIQDPAAFIYAASKRMPKELERISQLKSPHDRYAEMIRLESKLRSTKPSTKAPRPLGRSQDDTNTHAAPKKKNEETIEDLIAKSEVKKLAMLKQRRGR